MSHLVSVCQSTSDPTCLHTRPSRKPTPLLTPSLPAHPQVVATNANAAYVDLVRNLWAAMRRTGEANLLVRGSAPGAALPAHATKSDKLCLSLSV